MNHKNTIWIYNFDLRAHGTSVSKVYALLLKSISLWGKWVGFLLPETFVLYCNSSWVCTVQYGGFIKPEVKQMLHREMAKKKRQTSKQKKPFLHNACEPSRVNSTQTLW